MTNQPLQYGCYYHIYNRGNNRENIFVERRNYPYFLKLYAKYIQPVAETFAYCLLPNHFHLAIRTYTVEEQETYYLQARQTDSISATSTPIFKPHHPSRAFNNLFIAYARAFNKSINRTGVLFETPFHRKKVENQQYLTALITYIHCNPQNHGFVSNFREWEWSSYRAILSGKPTQLQRDTVLGWYDNPAHFTQTHADVVDESLIKPLVEDDFD